MPELPVTVERLGNIMSENIGQDENFTDRNLQFTRENKNQMRTKLCLREGKGPHSFLHSSKTT